MKLSRIEVKPSSEQLTDAERHEFGRYQKYLHIQASEMEFSIKRAVRAEAELAQAQTLLLSEQEKAGLAGKQKEEARLRAEESTRKLEAGVDALVRAGHTPEEARRILDLD